jgi:low affinity Fe/Cu permease
LTKERAMETKSKWKNASLTGFLGWSAKKAGHPVSFVVALSLVIIWFLMGVILGFDDRWILIINTVATINASLMVFIIQNTQNRESKALHIKLDELIRATQEAQDELMAIELMEEEELESIRKKYHRREKI